MDRDFLKERKFKIRVPPISPIRPLPIPTTIFWGGIAGAEFGDTFADVLEYHPELFAPDGIFEGFVKDDIEEFRKQTIE